MNQVFNLENAGSIALGSIKANIGHTDVASGVIGLIKVASMIQNREIPPQINFSGINSLYKNEYRPFRILTQRSKLDNHDLMKYFGVSSIGIPTGNGNKAESKI